MSDRTATAEQELRGLIDERVRAIHAKDPAPLTAQLAPDVLEFGVVAPLSVRGRADGAAATQRWFDSYDGGIGYEVKDVEAHAEGDLGYVTYLYHVTGTLIGDGEVDMWVRATLVCRRTDADDAAGGPRWLIVHDHESAPFQVPGD